MLRGLVVTQKLRKLILEYEKTADDSLLDAIYEAEYIRDLKDRFSDYEDMISEYNDGNGF